MVAHPHTSENNKRNSMIFYDFRYNLNSNVYKKNKIMITDLRYFHMDIGINSDELCKLFSSGFKKPK